MGEPSLAWTHDVIVIGAGAAGLTASGGCARLGLRVALVERDRMGGECLHTGCVPSKALLAVARRAQGMRGDRFGISGGAPAIDFAGVRAHVDGAIAAIAPHDSEARFAAWGVEVVRGQAALTGRRSVRVGDRTLVAPRIVLATGSDPAVPPIPGLAQAPFLTNETLFDLRTLPAHLLILGGGSVGVEMAQAFRRLGSAVTLVEAKAVLGGADPDAAACVVAALRADGVTVLEGAAVTRCRAAAGTITLERGGDSVDGTHLLVAAGRAARVSGLGLDAAGVACGPDGIAVDGRRRTSNKAVFAIGDCRAGPRLTHAAGYEGRLLVSALGFGLPGRADYRRLPTVTYTDPELAQIGLTEAQARAQYGSIEVIREAWAENDRAVAEGETAGFLKVVRARSGVRHRVVGVTAVGAQAGELLLPWALAMRGRASPWALTEAIIPYPTRSEISASAAFRAYEPVLFGGLARRWARALAWGRRGLRR